MKCSLNVQLILIVIVKSSCSSVSFLLLSKTITDLKMDCAKKMGKECEVSISAPNQLLPNMLHHVRGKQGESVVIILDFLHSMSHLWTHRHDGMLPEQHLKHSLGICNKCNLTHRAK